MTGEVSFRCYDHEHTDCVKGAHTRRYAKVHPKWPGQTGGEGGATQPRQGTDVAIPGSGGADSKRRTFFPDRMKGEDTAPVPRHKSKCNLLGKEGKGEKQVDIGKLPRFLHGRPIAEIIPLSIRGGEVQVEQETKEPLVEEEKGERFPI